jgi:hypothetical protein
MTMGPAPMIMIEAMSVRLGMRLSLARGGPAGWWDRERYSDPAREGKKPDAVCRLSF